MIFEPIPTQSAHLIWQSPLSAGLSRRRLPVALLRSNESDGGATFEYLRGTPDFDLALSEGFEGYTGIPLDRKDTSDAINTLGRRLLSPERPDYASYLARFGLSPKHGLSTLSLLAYTGAKLTSDSYSVADTFEGFTNSFRYIFDVAGRRHCESMTPSPQEGDAVIFRAEPDNLHDPNAVELLDDNANRYGYVNTCQARSVVGWLERGSVTGTIFRVNGRVGYPRLFVLAEISQTLESQAA
jgi:hypothetical protein